MGPGRVQFLFNSVLHAQTPMGLPCLLLDGGASRKPSPARHWPAAVPLSSGLPGIRWKIAWFLLSAFSSAETQTPISPRSELKASSDTFLAFINRMSFSQLYPLSGRHPPSPSTVSLNSDSENQTSCRSPWTSPSLLDALRMQGVGFCPGVCTQSSHRTLSPPQLAVTCSEVPCCQPTSYHWGAVATQFPYLGQPGGRLSEGQGEIKGGVQGEPGGENNFLVSLRGLRNTVGVRRSFQVAFFGSVPETKTEASDLWCRAPQG
ncbi:uncharacterized protein LOC114196387 [Eumetopias jubatus]|uniref:uncharacterized protein LOC114196387 n=1 Tax=Eumetopias jubatus TaxID=34886 RepID=UPI001016260B|nr:uncharacterized protein LOC114196387 [Eumetopias jubatus]